MKCRAIIACLTLLVASALSAAQMVVFGDSLSDGGYYFGVRFTNPGEDLWHEYLADRLGYQRATTSGFLGARGLNLAVAASRVSGLTDQVNRYADRYTWQAGDLCALWSGGNDLRDDPNQDMTALAAQIGDRIAQLATLGVDHFIVPNLPDLGAIPEAQANATLRAQRRAATIAFNHALAGELTQRAAELSIIIEQVDIFSLFDHMLFYAGDFGFTNTTDPLDDAPTAFPEEYVFWDDIHPTTRSHFLTSSAARAILDTEAPIEVISWSINPDLSFRQTWIADPDAIYQISSGEQLDSLFDTAPLVGSPAYTEVRDAPSLNSGFFQTLKN